MPVEKRWLNPEEAAEYLGVSKPAIYEMVKKRRIPFTRLGTAPSPGQAERRKLRFDLRALEAMFEENSVEAS